MNSTPKSDGTMESPHDLQAGTNNVTRKRGREEDNSLCQNTTANNALFSANDAASNTQASESPAVAHTAHLSVAPPTADSLLQARKKPAFSMNIKKPGGASVSVRDEHSTRSDEPAIHTAIMAAVPPATGANGVPVSATSTPLAKPLSTQHVTGPLRVVPASVFAADEDDDTEEIPIYARARMRNLGKETPTSAGPNSFGKTKNGFVDRSKMLARQAQQAAEAVQNMPK
eukprot:Opistho-2@62000